MCESGTSPNSATDPSSSALRILALTAERDKRKIMRELGKPAMTTDTATASTDRVEVLRSDVQNIIDILEQYVNCPEVWDPTIARLRAALLSSFPVYQVVEWQCRHVWTGGLCCTLPKDHEGEHQHAPASDTLRAFTVLTAARDQAERQCAEEQRLANQEGLRADRAEAQLTVLRQELEELKRASHLQSLSDGQDLRDTSGKGSER